MNEDDLTNAWTDLMLSFLETVKPIVLRARQANLIRPVEQAELDVIYEELLVWAGRARERGL